MIQEVPRGQVALQDQLDLAAPRVLVDQRGPRGLAGLRRPVALECLEDLALQVHPEHHKVKSH